MRLTAHAKRGFAIEDLAQDKIKKATYTELIWLWREVRLRLAGLKDQKPVIKAEEYTMYEGDLWEAFRQRLHKRIMAVIYSAGLDLLEHELELALSRDWRPPFEFDHERIIEEYTDSLATRITQVTITTQKDVAAKIAKWYQTPGETIGDLVNKLKPEFGLSRAELIAQTEITTMSSHIQERLATTLGYNTWWNETRRDQLVCKRKMIGPDNNIVDGCRGLHGKVFVVGKHKMPPHHPGCRCKAHIIHSVTLPTEMVQPPLFSKWEEAEHPRAADGRFESKAGDHKQTVGSVIRDKAKAAAPIIRNKQIAKIAHDHFNKAFETRLESIMDPKKIKLDEYLPLLEALKGSSDARNAFNNMANYLRDKVTVDSKEYNRILLNIRNRYYQKLRAANLKEEPIVVDVPKGKAEYIETSKLVDAFDNHPSVIPLAKAISEKQAKISDIQTEINQINAQRDEITNKYIELQDAAKDDDEWRSIHMEYQRKISSYHEQTLSLVNKQNEVYKELREAKKKHGEACRKLLVIPEDKQGKFDITNALGKKHDVDYEPEAEWLGTVTNVKNRLYGTNKWGVRMITINRNQRSYFHFGQIYLSRNAKEGVLVHEIGHYLEESGEGVHQKCIDFLNSRTKGETAKQLPGYNRGEIAKFDKFQDPYCGKIYPNNSEILSMGIGFLFNDAAGFAKQDPEYFEFVVKILRGEN